MNVIEPLEHAINVRSDLLIADEDVFEEVYSVDVVMNLLEILRCEDGFLQRRNAEVEHRLIITVVEEVTCEDLIQKTS